VNPNPSKPLLHLAADTASLIAAISLFARLTPGRKRRERWTSRPASDALPFGGNTPVLDAMKSKQELG